MGRDKREGLKVAGEGEEKLDPLTMNRLGMIHGSECLRSRDHGVKAQTMTEWGDLGYCVSQAMESMRDLGVVDSGDLFRNGTNVPERE